MKLDGYIRVSQVRGREGSSFISPDMQRAQIEQWAAMRGVEITAWWTDLDQSGGKLSRPGLDAIIERIRSGETGGIAVARLDRLSRAGVAGALKLVEDIRAHGGVLAAVDLGIDPTTVFGEFALTIMLALARMERRRITETWEEAEPRAVARGVHISSRTPTGYVRRKDGTLAPHPEWGPVITEGFRRRAEGASWRTLANLLNDAGVIGPYGSPHWRTRAVEHIIRNPVYLGEARSGRHKKAGAHEALTDSTTWKAAQAARGESVPRSEGGALLAGILRCAGCRYVMKQDTMRLRSGERVRMYRCRGEHAVGRCEARAAVLGSSASPRVSRSGPRAWTPLRAPSLPPEDRTASPASRRRRSSRSCGPTSPWPSAARCCPPCSRRSCYAAGRSARSRSGRSSSCLGRRTTTFPDVAGASPSGRFPWPDEPPDDAGEAPTEDA